MCKKFFAFLQNIFSISQTMNHQRVRDLIGLLPGNDTDKAEKIGMDRSRFSRLCNAGGRFTIDDIEKITKTLKIQPNDLYTIITGDEPAPDPEIIKLKLELQKAQELITFLKQTVSDTAKRPIYIYTKEKE